jgi:ribonuclease P protein component
MLRIHMLPPEPHAVIAHQIGIIAPKKLLRTSVLRNAAKRHIRESFRVVKAQLPQGQYVVRVFAHDRALAPSRWATMFRDELIRLWREVSARGAAAGSQVRP